MHQSTPSTPQNVVKELQQATLVGSKWKWCQGIKSWPCEQSDSYTSLVRGSNKQKLNTHKKSQNVQPRFAPNFNKLWGPGSFSRTCLFINHYCWHRNKIQYWQNHFVRHRFWLCLSRLVPWNLTFPDRSLYRCVVGMPNGFLSQLAQGWVVCDNHCPFHARGPETSHTEANFENLGSGLPVAPFRSFEAIHWGPLFWDQEL